MIKIRLSRIGKKKKPKYIIIVANSKSPRDSKFIEKIGFYDPILGNLKIKNKKFLYWKNIGAFVNNSVKKIIKKNKCIY